MDKPSLNIVSERVPWIMEFVSISDTYCSGSSGFRFDSISLLKLSIDVACFSSVFCEAINFDLVSSSTLS